MSHVVIIDYGMGNIKSVQRGLEYVSATTTLSSDPKVISNADYLVLPGVGAFEDGMKGLKNMGLVEALHRFKSKGNPLLGICLGMQMLLDFSEENGIHQGLGIIQGSVKAIPQKEGGKLRRKTPHIGWSELRYAKGLKTWKGSCLSNTAPGKSFYFVHSFMALPEDSRNILAQCDYEGILITAAVQKENVTGLQFHPEKSGKNGLQILQSFINK